MIRLFYADVRKVAEMTHIVKPIAYNELVWYNKAHIVRRYGALPSFGLIKKARYPQACGLPCVVSDIPGARDLIVPSGEKSTGILVEPRNPEAIAVAIETLAANPEMMKRMASKARQHISENFRLDGYVAYFDSILKSVIEQRNG